MKLPAAGRVVVVLYAGIILIILGFPSLIRAKDRASEAVAGLDPCALALVPHEGTGKLDQQIIRLQTKARSAKDLLPWVERLGWAFVAKARASFDPGFYTLAEQTALCLDSQQAGSAEAMLLRGHVMHSLHRFKEGEAVARALVAKRGLSFDYGLLGDLLMEQGKLDEAIDAYQKMMDQKPGPEAYSRAAHVRWLKGDLRGATELMQMAVGASGSGDPESAAWFRVRLAQYQVQSGELQKAAKSVDAALSFEPDYPPAFLARGRILLADRKAADAVEALERAAKRNPLPEYKWVLAEALRAANRTDEARAVEAELKKRGERDDPRTLALYLATAGEDVETAVRLAKKEMESRADVFTLDALAWASIADGDTGQASLFMRRAVAEGTQDARLLLHAAVIASAAGETQKAAAYLVKARALRQMLLPSEQNILRVAEGKHPILANGRKAQRPALPGKETR